MPGPSSLGCGEHVYNLVPEAGAMSKSPEILDLVTLEIKMEGISCTRVGGGKRGLAGLIGLQLQAPSN